ncbi:palmitoyltransferase ZDHHC19 isoform X3 [Mustela erminea]|uniref:palmitoyltransferase ZDHHC19 isoform X3 n=1 Tax=Mustela erminea TaxID=36723 RepID=UPI0013872FDF|nr:palmitoyltransferase ZDHHC19 isoform X3 [Mustela erminea]
MPLLKDAVPLMKEPHPPPQAPLPWILPSLFAAFNVVLLVVFSGLFFAFPCRWLAQNGEWAFPLVTGLLCVLTIFSLVSLNFSDPGILHQGSNEQGPMMVQVVWVNHRAFRLQWCQKCCFHRPPRTYHCPWCNICVEDFDHHCKWVNNCIGHRNFRFFMLLVLSLFLYSGAMLVTCLIFLVRTTHLPFTMDKAIAYPPRCRYLQGYNPFDHGCASNWYLTICAPLGPKYMAKAVWLQRMVGSDWAPMQNLHFPMCTSVLSPPANPGPVPGPQLQPLSLYKPGKVPPGSGEAPSLQEPNTGNTWKPTIRNEVGVGRPSFLQGSCSDILGCQPTLFGLSRGRVAGTVSFSSPGGL